MKKHTFRVAAAVVGGGAFVAMGAMSVAAGVSEAQGPAVIPASHSAVMNTTVYTYPVTLGIPTQTSSTAPAPAP